VSYQTRSFERHLLAKSTHW